MSVRPPSLSEQLMALDEEDGPLARSESCRPPVDGVFAGAHRRLLDGDGVDRRKSKGEGRKKRW